LHHIERIAPLAVFAGAVAAQARAGVAENHLLAQAAKDFNVLFHVNVGARGHAQRSDRHTQSAPLLAARRQQWLMSAKPVPCHQSAHAMKRPVSPLGAAAARNAATAHTRACQAVWQYRADLAPARLAAGAEREKADAWELPEENAAVARWSGRAHCRLRADRRHRRASTGAAVAEAAAAALSRPNPLYRTSTARRPMLVPEACSKEPSLKVSSDWMGFRGFKVFQGCLKRFRAEILIWFSVNLCTEKSDLVRISV